MPTKKKVSQKQKQRQSVVVNVNVAKARARASAKKSGKSGGRGSVMMLPPPIYTSPIDRLTPAMYGSQGQQIKEQPIEQLLKNFLSNQQNQQVGSFKTLGSAPESALPSKSEWLFADMSPSIGFRSLDSYPRSSSASYNPMSDNVSEMTDPSYMSELSQTNSERLDAQQVAENYKRAGLKPPPTNSKEYYERFGVPTPFQNEEKSYLIASEPDLTAPKFSQNEARVSQKNIYESLKDYESALPFYNRVEPSIYETLRSEFKKMDDEKY